VSNDEYVQQQLKQELRPGEAVELTAFMIDAPPIWQQILLLGGILSWLVSRYYFVALTNQRLILLKTKMGLLLGPRQNNLGIQSFERATITNVSTGGMMNNRSMTFHGPNLKLRISPRTKTVATQGRFFKEVPQHVGA